MGGMRQYMLIHASARGEGRMTKFCNDADILRYEPALFGESVLPGQVLAEGTGAAVSGTTLTAGGADFVGAQVSAGGVVYLHSADGVLDGAYEIVSVDSATELCVSSVRTDPESEAIPLRDADNVSYRVGTLGPQIGEIGLQLTGYLGIKPGDGGSDIEAEQILNESALKQATVFGTTSVVYAMLASKAEDDNYWKKSSHYQRLFEKAKERCRVYIDKDSDGLADSTRFGGCGGLVRE